MVHFKARDMARYLRGVFPETLGFWEYVRSDQFVLFSVGGCYMIISDKPYHSKKTKLRRAVCLDLTQTCTNSAIKPSAKICRRFLAHVKENPAVPP